MPRTPACSLDLPCDPNGSPLCACSLVRGRPLDAGGGGLVGSGSFAQSIESFNLFSIFGTLESRRHPHIGGFVMGSRVGCSRPAGSNAARSAVVCITLFGRRECSAVQMPRRLASAWPALASWEDARTFASRLRQHQVAVCTRPRAV